MLYYFKLSFFYLQSVLFKLCLCMSGLTHAPLYAQETVCTGVCTLFPPDIAPLCLQWTLVSSHCSVGVLSLRERITE